MQNNYFPSFPRESLGIFGVPGVLKKASIFSSLSIKKVYGVSGVYKRNIGSSGSIEKEFSEFSKRVPGYIRSYRSIKKSQYLEFLEYIKRVFRVFEESPIHFI